MQHEKITPKQFVQKLFPDAVCEVIVGHPASYCKIIVYSGKYHSIGQAGTEKYAWQAAKDYIINLQKNT